MLLVARLVSAFCMHISDCDETFNYWEPVGIEGIIYPVGIQIGDVLKRYVPICIAPKSCSVFSLNFHSSNKALR